MMTTFEPGNIIPLLYFNFWKHVYYLWDVSETSFPGTSTKLCGHWVSISEKIGPLFTFTIIAGDTEEEISVPWYAI